MNNKRKIICLSIVLCLLSVFNSFAEISLVTQRGSEITLQFTVPQYTVENVLINGKNCAYVKVSDAALFNEKGYPALPYFSQSMIIPDKSAMGLEIVSIKYKELKVNSYVPSKGVIYRNQNPADVPYVFGEGYAKDAWYPETAVKLCTPYIVRNIRGIAIHFQPFQYNAVKGILKVAESMTVKIKETGVGTINVLTKKFNTISPTFDKIYQNKFINYPHLRSHYDPVADGDKMIVISGSDYMSTMEPFVEWKNQKGIKTDLYEYGSDVNDVEDFIQEKYDEEGITYVLLVGDDGDVPTTQGGGGACDPCYVLLEGSDLYPEAFIGRFCGASTSDIEDMVNNVLKYEKTPDPDGEWYHKAMGIGSADGNPKDWQWISDMRDVMLAYNYTEVDEIYDPGASASEVTSGLNEGRSWVNYMGHGSISRFGTTGYGASNIAGLSNTDKLPVIISVACNNGEFDRSGNCLGEAFTKTGSEGCIVFLGSSISQSWTPPQRAQKEMVRLICSDTYISVGALIYNGEMEMLDQGNDQNTLKTWILFGDPSLMLFTDTPDALDVTHEDNIGQGTQQKFEVSFGSEINGHVSLFHAVEGIVGSALITGGDRVELTADVPDVDKITLTVTAFNKMPYEKEINVGPSGIIQSDLAQGIKFRSFPNPFRRTTNISFNNPAKNALVTIYSSAGKEIVSERVTGNSFRWDAVSQTSGIYFVKVKIGNKVFEKDICLIK